MDLKTPISFLNNLTAEEFIRDYWQKKPLLVRQGFKDLNQQIDADLLAGLALEGEVESRIVQHHVESDQWELHHGPFNAEDFQNFPEKHWTLLVQSVDQFLPFWSQFLDNFSFIPHWRIDDIMISYAVDQGSVGPHTDQYDVFLIQAEGKRRWQVGPKADETTQMLPHPTLRLLAEMACEEEWILEPGDLLYLPPKFAHHGIAEGECVTVSVGFRAPDMASIIREFGEYTIDFAIHEEAIGDADLDPQENPGWINPEKIESIQKALITALSDKNHFQRWFAEYVSQPKLEPSYDETPVVSDFSDLIQSIKNIDHCYRDEGTRFAYIGLNEQTPEQFFINGDYWPVPNQGQKMLLVLCQSRTINCDKLIPTLVNDQCEQFLLRLFQEGFLFLPDE